MSYLLGTLGAAGPGTLLAIHDEEKGALWSPQYDFGWRDRGPQALSWEWESRQRWPWSSFMCVDRSTMYQFGQCSAERAVWEPTSLGLSGHNSPYFLTGYCKDESNNPLGGALVEAYETASDLYVGECRTDSNGFFQVPCQQPIAHKLIARWGGKAGASADTLVPTRGP